MSQIPVVAKNGDILKQRCKKRPKLEFPDDLKLFLSNEDQNNLIVRNNLWNQLPVYVTEVLHLKNGV